MNLNDHLIELWHGVLIASIEGAVLVAVIFTVQRILRRQLGPTWSFALWLVVLLKLSLPNLPVGSTTWPRPFDSLRTQLRAIPSVVTPEPSPVPSVGALAATGQVGAQGLPLEGFRPSEDLNVIRTPIWASVASWVWLIGTLVGLVRYGVGLWIYRRKLDKWPEVQDSKIQVLSDACRKVMGISNPVEIRAVPSLGAPCLFGTLRPILLVPSHLLIELSDQEWRSILLHEFGHIRRRDPMSNAWMSLVGIVHWFNPLVRWAIGRMRQDRELACDQLVLARAGQEEAHPYGETLIKLASSSPPIGAALRFERIGIVEGVGPLKERLRALKLRPKVWVNAAFGSVAVGILASCALTQSPEVDRSGPIQPVNLLEFTDYPRTVVDSNVLLRRQDDPGMWLQIPHGPQTFFGVPFEISGMVRLAGRNAQRLNSWYFRPEVNGIPIGRAFDRLYLLHTTMYHEAPGAVIARVRLRYNDGRTAEVPIAYGTHTLNYWRQRYEHAPQLTDADSRVAWTGNAPQGVAEYGNSLRLVVSSLKNPHPKQVVQSVDLISTLSDASEVIVGMAHGGRVLPQAWQDTPISRYPKNDWKGELRLQALNAVTGKPISNLELRTEVAEPGVHSRIGTSHTDANGWATLKYPHADLNYITIWADHADYVPRLIQWTRSQHGPFPKEYVYRAEPGLRIGGRVTDPEGHPLSGALVRILGPRLNFAGDGKEFLALDHSVAVTDAGGNWTCSEIPGELRDGQVRIVAMRPGFAPSGPQLLTRDEIGGAPVVTLLSIESEK
jgi:beta-lactamase regulating signal transducer with metallopeptidase domain